MARIVANGTIFFLFIAGYLFEYLSSGFRTFPYWTKKIRNVVIPYVVVSVPAIYIFTNVIKRWDVRPNFYDQPIWKQVVEFLLTGAHLAPFWFIPTIIIFYVAAPVMHRAFSSSVSYAVLPLLLLVGAIVPRGSHEPLQSFIHFLPVWVLGMACSRFQEKVNQILEKIFWLLPLIVLLLFGAEIVMAPGTHSWYSDLQKDVLALFLLEGFRRIGSRADVYFGEFGTLSFGLFFLHSYIISGTRFLIEWKFGSRPAGGIVVLVFSACLAAILTALLVIILRRILGGRSRMLIGV